MTNMFGIAYSTLAIAALIYSVIHGHKLNAGRKKISGCDFPVNNINSPSSMDISAESKVGSPLFDGQRISGSNFGTTNMFGTTDF